MTHHMPQVVHHVPQVVHHYSVGMLSVLCNLSYAGMRAQGSPNSFPRKCAFIGGFPGTLVSYFAVKEGSNKCYGVHLAPSPQQPQQPPQS